jgi:drug/metabolite transporter (DMT)-like permease
MAEIQSGIAGSRPIQAGDHHVLKTLAGCGLALVAVAIWSGWLVITRVAVTSTLNAEDLSALRFGSAALLLLPVVWRRGFAVDRFGWRGLALIVICAGVSYVLLVSHGLTLATAAEAGVLVPGTIPLFVALISTITVHEKIGRVARIGLALIVAGVALIVVPALLNAAGWQLIGYAICLGSAIMWAAYTIAARKAGVDALHLTAIITVISGALFVPVYLLLPQQGIWHVRWTDFWIQLIYQGPLTGIIALLVYTRAIAMLGATRASAFTALLPLTAMLLAIPVVGEWPNLRTAIGAFLAASGVLLATTFSRR